jgi:rsbT co-antagonist protein RsbR
MNYPDARLSTSRVYTSSKAPEHCYGVAELLDMYNINASQLDGIRNLRDRIMPEIYVLIDRFYLWMEKYPHVMAFFKSESIMNHVKQSQITYWERLLQGTIDEDYLMDRRRIGEIHARIGLPLMIYIAGVSMMYEVLSGNLLRLLKTKDQSMDLSQAMANVLHMDAGLICQAFSDKLEEQNSLVLESSTPIAEVWDGILLLPIVGIVDNKRSNDILEEVLESIKNSKAKDIIVDVSGVGVVDMAVANLMINLAQATALMGCCTTVSGISPSITKLIVNAGIQTNDMKTTFTMMDALSSAFRRRGISFGERRQITRRK